MRHDCKAFVSRSRVLPSSIAAATAAEAPQEPPAKAVQPSTVTSCVGSTRSLQAQIPKSANQVEPNAIPLPGSRHPGATIAPPQADGLPVFRRTDLVEVQGWTPLPGSAGFGIDTPKSPVNDTSDVASSSAAQQNDGLPLGVWG